MSNALVSNEVLMSPEEYLTGDFEPDVDFVDGRIEDRHVGEYQHASWQEVLQAWFRSHYPEWKLRARPELRTKITPTRYRVPDVAVLDMNLPIEQIQTAPPVAVFEVLSPEDRYSRILIKLADYERLGVQNIFLIAPFYPENPHYQRYQNGHLRDSEPIVELAGSRGFVDWEQIRALIY